MRAVAIAALLCLLGRPAALSAQTVPGKVLNLVPRIKPAPGIQLPQDENLMAALNGLKVKTGPLPDAETLTLAKSLLTPLPPAELISFHALSSEALSKLNMRLNDWKLANVRVLNVKLPSLADSMLLRNQVRLCDGPEDICSTFRANGWRSSDAGRNLFGTLDNGAGTLFLYDDGRNLLGRMRIRQHLYSIERLAGNTLSISEVRPEVMERNLDDAPLAAHPGTPGLSAGPAPVMLDQDCPNPTGQPTIDVLFAYTPAARKASLREYLDVRVQARAATLLANRSFEASDVAGRVNLADLREVDYKEKDEFQSDIDEYLKADGQLAPLKALRTALKADVIVLAVDNDEPLMCGRAAGIGVDSSRAMVVVNWRCLTERFSYIHEMGHLAGAFHDPATVGDDADSTILPAYAAGYITKGPYPIATIMAYPTSCPKHSCARDFYWSNPYKTVDGQPLGTPDRNFDACIWRKRFKEMAAFDGR